MINQYIRELLSDNNRIIIPDFGAFIARVSSNLKDAGSLENKTIVFNDILKFNDGLLLNYIIKVENVDITVALQKVTEYTENIKAEFNKGNTYFIEGIGRLQKDMRGNVILVQAPENPAEDNQKEIPVVEKQDMAASIPGPPDIAPIIQEEKKNPEPEVKTEAPVEENKTEKIPAEQKEMVKEETKEYLTEKTEELKKEEIKKPLKKPEKKKKQEPVAATSKKKSKTWLAILIWSISGVLFLAMMFLGAVRFGFIKDIKIFPKDDWISVNDKLIEDLNDYNKKYKDQLKVSESKKEENVQKSEGSFGETSEGSFDTPSDKKSNNGKEQKQDQSVKSDQGSSAGNFDAPTDNKTQATVKDQKAKDSKTSSMAATGKYILVAGSFKSKDAADKFLGQLKEKGFSKAEYAGERNGMFMVCYGSFNDQNEAAAELNTLKQKGVQSWIMAK
ncbi:MAG: SPOR domain-containing protein [Bacteroidia bacterium]|nr:SPOR domain-containing protein [Bacteroidia bacterium]